MRRLIRSLLPCLAPPNSRRRRWLRGGKQLARAGRRWWRRLGLPGPGRLPPCPGRADEPQVIRAFLARCGSPPLTAAPAQAGASDLGAARYILHLLLERPDLRRRFPRALGDGPDGAFGSWLTSAGARELGLPAAAADHLAAAFRLRLGSRIRQRYDFDPELRRDQPLALTPAGLPEFVRHLFRAARADGGVTDEQIWWFWFESIEAPTAGLAACYLRQPDWQRRFPDGLTAAGWPALCAWVRRAHAVRGPWLDQPDPPAVTPVDDGSGPPGVNVLGHFCHPSGLGQAVHAVVAALHRAGVRTSCRDVPCHLHHDRPEHDDYLGLEVFDCSLVHLSPEPRLDLAYPRSGLAPRPGVRRAAIWYWELEAVPHHWVEIARGYDEIWAPTAFIARAMAGVLPVPVVHVMPGVELGDVPCLPRAHFGLPGDRCLFLFAFDMCSVMARKNPLGLIAAYRAAFRPDDRVALAIKVSRGSYDADGLRRLSAAAAEAGAILIDRVMTRAESYALMACCDAYVSLHRAEGFGLTMAEAMLLGKPVIATAYSGNLDFMTPANSRLVEQTPVAIAEELPHYRKGAVWAEPSVAQAAHWMRWVYEHPDEARALGARARDEARAVLSLDAAGARLRRRLQLLRAGTAADTDWRGSRCA